MQMLVPLSTLFNLVIMNMSEQRLYAGFLKDPFLDRSIQYLHASPFSSMMKRQESFFWSQEVSAQLDPVKIKTTAQPRNLNIGMDSDYLQGTECSQA